MNTDDRGPLDLTRQVDNLKQTVDGYKQLVETQHREIFELRKIVSKVESHKNLLQGYKKVIEDLSAKLRQKDS
tara:strand:- start:192 stop:410 length:219 start_codon:yes stop_codon:yes gene_type:complete